MALSADPLRRVLGWGGACTIFRRFRSLSCYKPAEGRPFSLTESSVILNTRRLLFLFVSVSLFLKPSGHPSLHSHSTYPRNVYIPRAPFFFFFFTAPQWEHATVPIPTDLEPDQEAMLKELREGEPHVELSLRVEIQRVHVLGV